MAQRAGAREHRRCDKTTCREEVNQWTTCRINSTIAESPSTRSVSSDLRCPIVVLDRQFQKQQTVATLTMSVNLPHHFKGTHMSRFVEVLNEHRGEVTMRTLPAILQDLKQRLQAESARIRVAFPYFLERTAPASGARALMDYECSFVGDLNGGTRRFRSGCPRPGHEPLPVQQSHQRLRRAQPARAHLNRRAQCDIADWRAGTDLDRGTRRTR